jgi:hypothetical protein
MIKNKNISFDFDGTLGDYFDGKPNLIKDEIIEILLNLAKNNKIHIITRRYGLSAPHTKESIIVYALAKKLNISEENVHFTNREMKIAAIRKNDIYLHFDDDQYEVSLLSSLCKIVNVESKNWKGEIPND